MTVADKYPNRVKGSLFAPGLVAGFPVSLNAPTVTSVNFPTATVTLNAGATLDFALDADGSYLNDSTAVRLVIEAPDSCATPTPPVDIKPLPVTQSGVCGPWQVCFDVDIFNTAVANSPATVSLQLYQNGLPVGTPLVQTAIKDGKICFDIPASTNGLGYDYTVRAVFPIPGQAPIIKILGNAQIGQSGAQNDDLACKPPTASCCPNFMSEWGPNDATAGYFGAMFSIGAPSLGAPATLTFNATSANALQLAQNLKQWVEWLKFNNGCKGLVGFQLTLQPIKTNSTPPTKPYPPQSGPSLGVAQTASIINGTLSPSLIWPNIPAMAEYGYVSMTLTPIGQNGQPIKCDLGNCASRLFTRWHYGGGSSFKATPGPVSIKLE